MTYIHPPREELAHADVDQLGDYLDGALSSGDRTAIDDHLVCCEECRARLGTLRLLVERAAHAPASIEPDDDLWPEIHHAIESRRTLALPLAAGAGRPAASRRRVVAAAAAAATAIAALSSATTALLLRRPTAPRPPAGCAAPAADGHASDAPRTFEGSVEPRRQ